MKCEICGRDFGEGGVTQEDGSVLCVTCDRAGSEVPAFDLNGPEPEKEMGKNAVLVKPERRVRMPSRGSFERAADRRANASMRHDSTFSLWEIVGIFFLFPLSILYVIYKLLSASRRETSYAIRRANRLHMDRDHEVKRFPCPNCGERIPVEAKVCRFCSSEIGKSTA